MSWAGALISMTYSHLNFSSFKQLKNAKKVKCDGSSDRRMDGQTDQPTNTVNYRSRCPRQKLNKTGFDCIRSSFVWLPAGGFKRGETQIFSLFESEITLTKYYRFWEHFVDSESNFWEHFLNVYETYSLRVPTKVSFDCSRIWKKALIKLETLNFFVSFHQVMLGINTEYEISKSSLKMSHHDDVTYPQW